MDPRYDPNSPSYDPMAVRSGLVPTQSLAHELATDRGPMPGFNAAFGASPEVRGWLNDSLASFGIQRRGPNLDLEGLLSQPLYHPQNKMPFTQDFRQNDIVRDKTDFDFFKAVAHGFGETFTSGLISFNNMRQAAQWEFEDGYDVWADPRIREAGLQNQFELFRGSRSSAMTGWLISRFQQQQRDHANYESMSGPKEMVSLAGNILGDPTSYMPQTLGVKGAQLAKAASRGALTGADRALVAARKPAWGTIGDGMRTFGIQAAAVMGENAIAQGYDPVDRIDQVANDIFLPSAIAGSLGLLLGAAGRFSAHNNMLAAAARQERFLHGTLPTGTRIFEGGVVEGARFVDPAFVGPVVPAERRAAEELLGPAGRSGHAELQRIEAAKLTLQPYNVLADTDGVLTPGSLATDYGDIIKREARGSSSLTPFLKETLDFQQFAKGNKLFDEAGQPFMVYHSTYGVFDEFSNKKLGRYTGAESATMGHFFAGKPETAAGYAPTLPQDPQFPSLRDWTNQLGRRFTGIITRSPQGSNQAVREYYEQRFLQKMGGKPNTRPSYIRMTNPFIVNDMDLKVMSGLDATPGEQVTDLDEQTWIAKEGKWVKPYNRFADKRPVHDFDTAESVDEIMIVHDQGAPAVGVKPTEKDLWDGSRGFIPMEYDENGVPWMARREPDGRIVWARWGESEAESTARWEADVANVTDNVTVVTNDANRRNVWYSEEIKKAKELGHDGVVIRNTYDAGDGPPVLDDIYIVFDPATQIRGFDQRYDVADLPFGSHYEPAQRLDVTELGRRDVLDRARMAKGETVQGRPAEGAEMDANGRPYTKDPGVVVKGDHETMLHLDAPSWPDARQWDADDFPIGAEFIDWDGRRWKNQSYDGTGDARGGYIWRYLDDNPRPVDDPKVTAEEATKTEGAWRPVHPGEVHQPGMHFRMNQTTGVSEVFDTTIRGYTAEEKAAAEVSGLQPGSVGAASAPGSMAYREDILRAQGRMASTGIGIENVPLNGLQRIARSMSVRAMQLAHDLMSTGGAQTLGHQAGMANLPPVEKLIELWWKPLVDNLRFAEDQWSAYRTALGNASGAVDDEHMTTLANRTDPARLAEQVGIGVKDFFNRGQPGLSLRQFRGRVAEALNNGDVDEVTDAATPFVNRTAANDRKLYSSTRDLMVEHGVFDEAYQKALDQAHSRVVAIKKEADEVKRQSAFERWDPARTREVEEALLVRMEDAEYKYGLAKEKLDQLRAQGPMAGGGKSYRPRMWDADGLIADEQEAVSIFTSWLQTSEGGQHALPEAARIAKEMHTTLSKQNPIYLRGDAYQLFQSVASPDSAMARTFTIPDKLVSKWLVSDSETLMRYHIKQASAAIEMKKRFGNLDLAEQIAEVEQEYRQMVIRIDEGKPILNDPAEAARIRRLVDAGQGTVENRALIGQLSPEEATLYIRELTDMMKSNVADLQAMRDKIYGTYGAATDPTRLQSRMIRMAKQYTNMTLLGLSGITAMGDVVRPLMTEGFQAMYEYGFKTLMSDSRAAIMRMSRDELELMGEGMDLKKNIRALQVNDTGEFLGPRGGLEYMMNKANQHFFVLNGMNAITDWTKTWAATQIMGRVNHILLDSTIDLPLTGIDRGRFAAANIGDVEAKKIGLMLKIYGIPMSDRARALIMPNTTAWTDQEAAILYRTAINQMVNRTIPTPGLGDRWDWMSTEWGSLISQYKAFSVATQIRTLQSGLQEGGSQFWYGAAGMIAFAALLNEVKSRLFYDRSTFDRPTTAVIADAVDRSSVLGLFTDVNRAVEQLTGNRAGVRPLIGASQPRPVNWAQATGTVLGPAAGQAVRAADVAGDFMSGHPTARTFANARTLLPYQGLPFVDPVTDRLISDGSFHRNAGQARQIDRELRQRAPKPGAQQQPAG